MDMNITGMPWGKLHAVLLEVLANPSEHAVSTVKEAQTTLEWSNYRRDALAYFAAHRKAYRDYTAFSKVSRISAEGRAVANEFYQGFIDQYSKDVFVNIRIHSNSYKDAVTQSDV